MALNFEQIVSDVAKATEALMAHNVDQSIPLDERWATFLEAPEYLKDYESWHADFDTLPSDFIGYDGPVYAERRERIYTDYVVDAVEQHLEEMDEDEREDCEIDIVKIKEDILRRNLAHFTFDW